MINFTSVWTLDILEYGEGILKEYLHQYVEMPIVPRPDCQEDYSEVKRLYHDNIFVDRTSDKVHKRRRKSESCIIFSFSNRIVFILGKPPPTFVYRRHKMNFIQLVSIRIISDIYISR